MGIIIDWEDFVLLLIRVFIAHISCIQNKACLRLLNKSFFYCNKKVCYKVHTFKGGIITQFLCVTSNYFITGRFESNPLRTGYLPPL